MTKAVTRWTGNLSFLFLVVWKRLKALVLRTARVLRTSVVRTSYAAASTAGIVPSIWMALLTLSTPLIYFYFWEKERFMTRAIPRLGGRGPAGQARAAPLFLLDVGLALLTKCGMYFVRTR